MDIDTRRCVWQDKNTLKPALNIVCVLFMKTDDKQKKFYELISFTPYRSEKNFRTDVSDCSPLSE